MHRLILLRHAKAEMSKPGMSDHDRDLIDRGREAMAKIGAYMARHALSPDRVLCSTARRARVTWEVAAAQLDHSPAVVYERGVYNASANALIDLVRATDDQVHSLMVVGHNPGLHEFADRLIASGDLDHRERLKEKLPTAGLVVIDFTFERWAELRARAGRLERFVAPHWLETTTE